MIIYNIYYRSNLKEPVLLRIQGNTAHVQGHLQTKQNRFFIIFINECARKKKAKISESLNNVKMEFLGM